MVGILAWVALAHLAFIYCHQLLYPQKFPDDDYEYVSKDTIEAVLANTFALVNGVFGRLRKATSTEEFVQVLLALFVLSYISQLFSTEGMLWLLTLGAFGFPVIYEKNQTAVDQQIEMIKNKWQDVKINTFDKIPRASSCKTDKGSKDLD